MKKPNEKSRLYSYKGWFDLSAVEMLVSPLVADVCNILSEVKPMWCPKNRLTGEVYKGKFDSAMSCQEYIDTKFKFLNKIYRLLAEEERDLGLIKNYNGANIIQAYNFTDKRWADGFDF